MNDRASELSDRQLIERSLHGEPHRFGELVRRYREALLRTAASRLGGSPGAEDVVQETMLAAFKGRHTYKPEYSVRTWLWTILLNQCKAHWQRQRRRDANESTSPALRTGAEAADRAGCERATSPFEQLWAQERRAMVEQILAELPPELADAVRLRFHGGLKFQEIADTVGCSLGTAKNRVRAGLERMAAALQTPLLVDELPPAAAIDPRGDAT